MENIETHRYELGKTGEDIACDFLKKRGHVILERNFRSGHLEIDIISTDVCGIHFVEVKTRRFSVQAPPQESVTPAKQRRIVRAASQYLKARKSLGNPECFFDVFAVTFNPDSVTTEWIPQAFIPIYK